MTERKESRDAKTPHLSRDIIFKYVIKFQCKCTKAQIIRVVFTNNLI